MAQSSASGTSSRRHLRDHDAASPGSPRYIDSDREAKEALLLRELEETKARAAQMEKTMRWWSDCTANWREKWGEVRDERNKTKKEAKVLKAKLESTIKDLSTYKQEYQNLQKQNIQLKKELQKFHSALLNQPDQFDKQLIEDLDSQTKNALCVDELFNNIEKLSSKGSSKDDSINGQSISDKDVENYTLQGAVPKHSSESSKDNSPLSQDKRHSKIDVSHEEALIQKISILNFKLEEATKTISVEREEKSSLHRGMERLKHDLIRLKERYEELQDSRTEALKELVDLKSRFKEEITIPQNDVSDEIGNREGLDRRLSELRTELEKLQAENAAEWGKRERLESEKISLERENKQLRSELRDLQDRTESRRARPISSCDVDAKHLQQELLERNKELVDLKHAQSKLKKMLAEKTTELSHASRRSEQYEAEVKRIRARVEELKKDLALAQDEVDAANDSIRRLQRTNEDLTEQLENLNGYNENQRKNSAPESKAPDVVADLDDKNQDENKDSTAEE